jgi:outer membrane protein OmpA-like peptidoglycan-associated protein
LEMKPLPLDITTSCLAAATPIVVTLRGERLDGVLSASVAGLAIGLSKVSSNSLDLAIPALNPGTYDITYVSAHGLVIQQSAIRVCAASTDSPVATVSPTVSPSTSPTSSPSTSPEPTLVRDDLTVFFAADSSRLSSSARDSLADLAQRHLKMRSSFVVVEGFARSATNPSYARSLAIRRAQAVISFLRSQGLSVFFRSETTINGGGSPAQNRKAAISITSRPSSDRS